MPNTYDTPTVKLTCSTCLGFGVTLSGTPATSSWAQSMRTLPGAGQWCKPCPECGSTIWGEAVKLTIITLESGITFDARMLDNPVVNFHREQPAGEIRPDGEYTYTAQVILLDGTILEAKGLRPADSKEFHDRWSARRTEIKLGRR